MMSPALLTTDASPAQQHAAAVDALWAQLSDQWSQDQAEQFAEHVDAWLDAADGAMVTRLGDVAAYLASFVESGREPNTAQRIRLAELVGKLGAAASEAEPPADSAAAAQPRAAAKTPDNITSIQGAIAAASRQRTSRNTLCLLGVGDKLAPGLQSALGERGYDLQHFGDAIGLREFLNVTVPGAVIMTAMQLRTSQL
ncbi:MAG: hypothetical protein IPH50_06445 [Rhodanobacteraceae bacterium]|nr:hypothetical protein [Rhodanobacteraceae bacterium]